MKRIVQIIVAFVVLFVLYIWTTQPNMFASLVADLLGAPTINVIDQLPTVDEVVPTLQSQIDVPTIEVPVVTIEGNVIRLTEADINAQVANFGTEQVQITQVRLVPDQIILGLSVAGLTTELTANLVAIDGQVVVQNPALSGVAGALIPIDELVGPLQAAINQTIAQNAPVSAIRIDNGVIEVELNR